MVVELLLNPKHLSHNYWTQILVGLFYSLLAGLLSHWLFPSHASIITLLFVILATAPFIHRLIEEEERKKANGKELEHVVLSLLSLFIGLVIGFTLIHAVSPVFGTQLLNLQEQVLPSDLANKPSNIDQIILGNLSIVGIALLLAFLFQVGAIFITTWNASVLAVAINLFAIQHDYTLAIIRFGLHGIFEFVAFFLAGIAGSLLSASIANKKRDFRYDFRHIIILFILSVVCIIIGGIVEVFVTPLFY